MIIRNFGRIPRLRGKTIQPNLLKMSAIVEKNVFQRKRLSALVIP
jgi:hypothetical protein